jgi:hypothetical protein
MELEKLYSRAKSRHGELNRDVVHDMYCKFGAELPSIQYVTTCIKHAKPEPVRTIFEVQEEFESDEDETFEDTYNALAVAVNTVRAHYPLEVDTFLECHVNGSYKAFGERSGIARSVLEKICKFARYEILKELDRTS